MMTDRRLLGGALGFALLVAACGSSNASSSPSATADPSGSEAPSESPSAGANASGGPEISLSAGQAADLKAMLPSSIGSTQLQKSSFDGAQMPVSGLP